MQKTIGILATALLIGMLVPTATGDGQVVQRPVCGPSEIMLAETLDAAETVGEVAGTILDSQVLVEEGTVWLAKGHLVIIATESIEVQGSILARDPGGSITLMAPSIAVAGTVAAASGQSGSLSAPPAVEEIRDQLPLSLPHANPGGLLITSERGHDGGSVVLQAASLELASGSCVGTGDGGHGGDLWDPCVRTDVGDDVLKSSLTGVAYVAGAGGKGGDLVLTMQPAAYSLEGDIHLGNGGHGGSATVLGSPRFTNGQPVQGFGGVGGDSGFPRLSYSQANLDIEPLALWAPAADAVTEGSGRGGNGGSATVRLSTMGQCWDEANLCIVVVLCDGLPGEDDDDGYAACAPKVVDGGDGHDGMAGTDLIFGSSNGERGQDGQDGVIDGNNGGHAEATGESGGAGYRHGGDGGDGTAEGQCGGVGSHGGDGGDGGEAPDVFGPNGCRGAGGNGGRGTRGGDGGDATASGGDGGDAIYGNGGDGGDAISIGGDSGRGGDGGDGGDGRTGGGGGQGAPDGSIGRGSGGGAGEGGDSLAGADGSDGTPTDDIGTPGGFGLSGHLGAYLGC